MRQDDARKLDHTTLEEMRMRAVRSVQAGESPEVVARSMRINRRTIYGWLAQYRRGGWGALKAKAAFGQAAQTGCARLAMDLHHHHAEEPVATEVRLRAVDARHGGKADQG